MVVIGQPIKVKDLDEVNTVLWPGGNKLLGVEATFAVSKVLKSDFTNRTVVLHYYRWENPYKTSDVESAIGSDVNSPGLIYLTPTNANQFLLYLVSDGTSRYAPASGQLDSAGCSIKPLPTNSVAAPKQDEGAKEHFKDYLAKCDTNEVRCLWFLDDKPEVGMVMTINLNRESVFTVREVYNWAEQSSETRKLTHSQILNLKKIIGNLPASDKNPEFNKSVFVSLRNGSQVEIFQYNRQDAPAIIQRIYDIGGGYFEDDKP